MPTRRLGGFPTVRHPKGCGPSPVEWQAMPILTHGSDLTLAPTMGPIVRLRGGALRAALDQVAAAGFTAVQLDATLPSIRPRELDSRARKDLLALLARSSLRLAGVDLFIRRRHYMETEHQDRAMHATLAAINLAAELGRVPLSLALPIAEMADDLKQEIVQAADRYHVRLAVHGEDQLPALTDWLEQVDLPILSAAIDPATILARSDDPVATAHELASRLGVSRLSDLMGAADSDTAAATMRCPVGEGELDVMGYRIAIDLAVGRAGPVVLDLRGLSKPMAAAATSAQTWQNAAIAL